MTILIKKTFLQNDTESAENVASGAKSKVINICMLYFPPTAVPNVIFL